MTEPTELELQLALAKALPELLLNDDNENLSDCCHAPFHDPGWPDSDMCSRCHEHCGLAVNEDFYWIEGLDWEPVTPREWPWIVQEVEKELTEYTLLYVEELKRDTYNSAPHAISYEEYIAKELEWNGDVFAPWQTRALALVKIGAITL